MTDDASHAGPEADGFVRAWSRMATRSDGRLGPVSLLVLLMATWATWRAMLPLASEDVDGSVTVMWSVTGVMTLACAAAVRMRIHDMAEARRTQAITTLIGLCLVFCIIQTPQAGEWPDIGILACLAAWAVVLLRPGVARVTSHGPPPRHCMPSFPPKRRSGRGAILSACWIVLWIATGAFVEVNMHEYRHRVDRRNETDATRTSHADPRSSAGPRTMDNDERVIL